MKKRVEDLLALHGFGRNSGDWRDYERAKALYSEVECHYEHFIRVVTGYLEL